MTALAAAGVWIALLSAVYAIGALAYGLAARKRTWIDSGMNAAVMPAVLLTVSSSILVHALVTHDFSLVYVARNSSLETPLLYRVSGLWGGQAGSLLFWTWMMAVLAAVVVYRHRRADPELMPAAAIVLMAILAFFAFIVAAVESPFRTLPFPPTDGRGLNPLLEDPGMVIHPPLLYLGYVGFAVPFAFALAALATGRLDPEWLAATRRWALLSWAALGAGLLVGGWWAYRTLGWGGYWGWDPVENAALMPWLVATAYVHSAIIQERRGLFAAWNVTLVILTFALAFLGTFLTRSGLVVSVHTFAQSEIGAYFLALLAVLLLGSFGLLAWRWDDLRDPAPLDSLASREGAFLFNNVLFLGFAFAVLVGTLFPILSEAVRGVQIFVGPPYFRQISAPIGIALLVLMGVGVLLPWRRATVRTLVQFRFPLFVTLCTSVAAAVLLRRPGVVLALAAVAFALGATLQEYHRGAKSTVPPRGRFAPDSPTGGVGAYLLGLAHLFVHQRRRYGGYLVHLATLVIVVGVVASHAYVREREVTVRPGESFRVGSYTVTYHGLRRGTAPNATATWGLLEVRGGGRAWTVEPLRLFYPKWNQPVSRPGIRSTLQDDVYAVLAAFEPDGRATLRVWVNPMVRWIWIGGIAFLLGTAVAAWPDRLRAGTRTRWPLQTLRDLEADWRTGKLSQRDYEQTVPQAQRHLLRAAEEERAGASAQKEGG
ncbi:MAG: heme lyase CcmF/NrfE family subunit [Armatimonadota bacterium]|nr:heme lyase CcmF/NrfE family subunit [Armatimonadota bacterium]MDR5696721.1 heme lyase CcmF/NrfE family subunit [Armatimonadota bacterium]